MIEERFDASVLEENNLNTTPWWGVHAARYRFALPFVKNCRVLDIACGTGYGLSTLKTSASFVVGADISLEAAQKAKSVTRNSGSLSVIVSDGRRLPFPSETFDVITSFETIEHLENRDQFVADLRRVLKPEGLLIISTPNALFTQPVNGKPLNPHHLFEYMPDEMLAELRRHFAEIEHLGQTLDPAFGITPFYDEQQKLPRDLKTQIRLLGWRVLNKLPFSFRESLSRALWGKSFYPSDKDYLFDSSLLQSAPVQVALCRGIAKK